MLIIKNHQLHAMALGNKPLLHTDIKAFLSEHNPNIQSCYPAGYFNWVVNDSIWLAEQFHMDDVYSLRTFVGLRWDIAPGFYKQRDIAAVLNQTNVSAENRFKQLATENYAAAWLDAMQFDSEEEWRKSFWEYET